MEDMTEILAKLTETLQLTRDGIGIVSITPLRDVARVTYSNGHIKDIDIGSDSGIAAIYDIAKMLMY